MPGNPEGGGLILTGLKGAYIMVGRQGSRRVTRMAVRDIQGGSPSWTSLEKASTAGPEARFLGDSKSSQLNNED